MLTLYLVCLIVGGALIALSIFAGGDLDVDSDVSVDFESEGAAEIEGASGEEIGASRRILSLRNGTFFVGFFGLTGTLFTMLGIGFVLTPIFSVAGGLAAAFAIQRVMLFLEDEETGALPDARALEGARAEVVVDIAEQRSGKIAIKGGDRILQLVARVHEQAQTRRFQAGDEVVIVSIDDGVAQVASTAFLA